MAQPARNPEPEAPVTDPETLERAYRLHQAKRRARIERERERRRAHVRFWVVLLLLVALMVTFAVLAWHQVQHLFGIVGRQTRSNGEQARSPSQRPDRMVLRNARPRDDARPGRRLPRQAPPPLG